MYCSEEADGGVEEEQWAVQCRKLPGAVCEQKRRK